MVVLGLALLGSPVISSSLGPSAHAADDSESTRRLGVIALASAISAVGQTPELSTALPFTTTTLADVLDLDEQLTSNLDAALSGQDDLALGLSKIPGIGNITTTDNRISFTYARTVDGYDLPLVHDDGDLRFGPNGGAGDLDVSLTTDPAHPFVVQVDPHQSDPLLKVALVSQPQLDLTVDIDTPASPGIDAFMARQGFTEVRVTGGHYQIHRDQDITLRDPDGRSLLTLEDLRYSTLPDLFRITTGLDSVDVGFGVSLPSTLDGGSGRTGTMSVDQDSAPDAVWPSATDATRTYGAALEQATGLTMVDGLTGLAQYTGTTLALQDSADVDFPNLGGSTGDLFAPGDRLLDLLSSAAAAQVQCGAAPQLPPAGVAAPGDTVYCIATTAEGLGDLTDVEWSVKSGGGHVVLADSEQAAALGPDPSGLVRIDGSDGEPDVEVSFQADGQDMVARSMPHTVQDVTRRIGELTGSSASASLSAHRLDVAVDIEQASHSEQVPLGNADGLGALVGLTGLKSPDPDNPAEATATATGASFKAGFGIQTGTPDADKTRETYLLPGTGGAILKINGLSATAPSLTGLAARIGFLEVTADLASVSLGQTSGHSAVTLATDSGTSDAIALSSLLNSDGALDQGEIDLVDKVTAGIGFTAHEQAISGSTFASGVAGGASGTATVSWGPDGLPQVGFGTSYNTLRVFDPAPAVFLSGTAHVTEGNDGADGDPGTEDDVADTVRIDGITELPDGASDLYDALGVDAPTGGAPAPELARRLLAGGPACQTVTVFDADSLTCTGLAPGGEAAYGDGDAVDAIVLGDPFALRDSVIEGLSTALASFGRIDGDHVNDGLTDDQYNSTLPLVDLRPAQLAFERDGLTTGLAKMSKAATEDEQVDRHRPANLPSVSSAQELEAAIDSLMGTYPAALHYTLGGGSLGISLSAQTPSGKKLDAPLRLMVDDPGQVVTERAYKVGVSSSTTLAIDVDVDSARPVLSDGTGTSSTATLALPGGQNIAGDMQAGVGTADVAADSGSTAELGVTVDTSYDASSGEFETTRSNALSDDQDADAATADLVTGDLGTIQYRAKATDTSGGDGATQPERQPMQVKYLAEGLDGLASALGQATDGAAPRNIGPGGAPISAPLIGTDLDAGAGVSDILTSLTSQLRTQLDQTDVAHAADAAELIEGLESAMDDAVDATDGLDPATGITATVSCGSEDGTCDPDACDEDTAPVPCETDTSTGWDVVTLSVSLTGTEKTTEADDTDAREFQTGLAGLALRTDKTITTTTSWTLPVTLRLTRGTGPQVVINPDDALALDVEANLPDGGLDAIVGYLPAHLTATGDGSDDLKTRINLALGADGATGGQQYDLFDLYDGKLSSTPSFTDPEGTDNEDPWKDGLSLDFLTYDGNEGATVGNGALHLRGTILMPWTAADGFGDISYDDVQLDVGAVVSTMATPFKVIDPYLAPVRDVIDVLRTPIPVVSDLSELAGGGEVSLLSILEHLSEDRPKLDIAYRVIGLIDGVTKLNGAIATFGNQWVDLADVAAAGEVLKLEPKDVELYSKCTETVATTTTTATTSTTKKTAPAPCPDEDSLEEEQTKSGVAGQTTGENRTGTRKVKKSVAQTTKSVTGQIPGFSLPFMEDTDQILDVLTGAGEATYFRVDFGTLAVSVAYQKKFGPIMAGPVPIVPFVGGSISVEGRLAMGFDSYAQTLAYQSLPNPGDVDSLRTAYASFDGGDIIREGFYLDDLDGDGVDVPEVKLVTTLEAGASVSIGIVSAGLKGAITLTINLDLNDPNDDGKLRTAEIRDRFGSDPLCAFEVSADLEASITIFVEIELLIETLEYEFDILRLGPYELFHYGCPDQVPTLVERVDDTNQLALTSGSRTAHRNAGSTTDASDEYEVRQFDTGGGANDRSGDGETTYEVGALGRVQRVEVTRVDDDSDPATALKYHVLVYQAGEALSTETDSDFNTATAPVFVADGGAEQDKISFLTGETFDEDATLVTTPFSTNVASLTGGADKDTLVTGTGNDSVFGEAGEDSIDVGGGDDVADGGSENDIMSGGAGSDDLTGGTGDDHIEGGAGADRAVGGDGNDSLQGGPGRDVRAVLIAPEGTTVTESSATPQLVKDQVLAGFDSGDVLVGGPGSDTVDGGDGSDVVVGGDATSLTGDFGSLFKADGDRAVNVIVRGGDGIVYTKHVRVPSARTPDASSLDTLCSSGTPLSGASSRDFVTGGPEADIVVGGNGPDTLDGGSGPDEICGRAAADQISGDGAQTEDDGKSADVIRGGTGDDQADGGPGDDVMYGDDVSLVRTGTRHLDGSLGASGGTGAGKDYLLGGDGNDILAGEGGSDLLIGAAGNDQAFGEGSDTPETGGPAPDVADRLLACNPSTRVIDGKIDLNGDLLAGAGDTDEGLVADSGQLAGLRVVDGVVQSLGSSTPLDGLLGGDVVLIGGLVDLDHDGTAGGGDTGMIPFASMLDTTGSNADGDCVLAGEGNDKLSGGQGSDYLGAGDGTDLGIGGDGNDLILGDDGTDVLLGGTHSDVLVGGLGDDRLQGGDGDDRLRGNDGADDLIGGSATASSDDGQDVLLGGREKDVLVAENGSIYSPTINTAVGAGAVPWRTDGRVPGDVQATSAPFSGSALACGHDPANRWLTLLKGDGAAGTGVSSPGVDDPGAYDELYGGFDCDFVFGSEGNDVVRGGQDSDMVEAGPGADYVYGDDGDDVVIGGSSYDPSKDTAYATTRSGGDVAPDAGDTIHGDRGADSVDGSDLVMGDNALPTRLASPDGQPGPDYVVELLGSNSGNDVIDSGGSDDRVFGQGGNDSVDAGEGNDYVEGNEGKDTLAGQAGDDNLIGGSSAKDGQPLGLVGTRLLAALDAAPYDSSAAGVQDANDTIDGGTGADYVLGDNGRLTRPPGRARDVALTQETASGTSGNDLLRGGDDADRLFGEDGSDEIHAGLGDDYSEGNAGADTVYGDAGADTVIGGASVSPASDAASITTLPTVNMVDSGDFLYGDDATNAVAGSDLVLGDNATVLWVSTRPVVQLAQVPKGAFPVTGTSGGDTIYGGGLLTLGSDVVFGQGGNDQIWTGAAPDYIEGNDDLDTVWSGSGNDTVIGGSSANNGRPLGDVGTRLQERMTPLTDATAAGIFDGADTIHAGGGADAVLGDNGRITRPLTGHSPDVAMADLGGADERTFGSDSLYGEAGDDDLYGQLDDGTSTLATGDRLEGGDGRDSLVGDLAVIDRMSVGELSEKSRQVAINSDAIVENLFPAGEDIPTALVPDKQATVGGPDIALGGAGNDVIRMGGGRDIANGESEADVVFGGDANDALWGGVGHDRIFGGYGDDDLDLKIRSGDPAQYALGRDAVDADGNETTNNGPDLIYGGWGADELQVDVGGAGKSDTASDHVVDWVGAHNVYYVCGGAYGAGRVVRQQSPAMIDLLTQLVLAAGDRDAGTTGTGGFYDLGMVPSSGNSSNNSPSPEAPGHFTCG